MILNPLLVGITSSHVHRLSACSHSPCPYSVTISPPLLDNLNLSLDSFCSVLRIRFDKWGLSCDLGKMSALLDELPLLMALHLENNKNLTGDLAHIKDLTRLETLQLNNTKVDGESLSWVRVIAHR